MALRHLIIPAGITVALVTSPGWSAVPEDTGLMLALSSSPEEKSEQVGQEGQGEYKRDSEALEEDPKAEGQIERPDIDDAGGGAGQAHAEGLEEDDEENKEVDELEVED